MFIFSVFKLRNINDYVQTLVIVIMVIYVLSLLLNFSNDITGSLIGDTFDFECSKVKKYWKITVGNLQVASANFSGNTVLTNCNVI